MNIEQLNKKLDLFIKNIDFEGISSFIKKLNSNKIKIDDIDDKQNKYFQINLLVEFVNEINLKKIPEVEIKIILNKQQFILNKAIKLKKEYCDTSPVIENLLDRQKVILELIIAQAKALRSENRMKLNYINNGTNYLSIYDLFNNNDLLESTKAYRLFLKEPILEQEVLNSSINIAKNFYYLSRYTESLTQYLQLINSNDDNLQMYLNYVNGIENAFLKSKIFPTISLYIKLISYLKKAEEISGQSFKARIKEYIQLLKNEFNVDFQDGLIIEEKNQELEEFKGFNDYRKWTLQNGLALNEHSLYCFCNESKKDNLKLPVKTGSFHSAKYDINFLNGITNRILSEYTYARKLFYEYKLGNTFKSEDIEFTKPDNENLNDELGYNIEQLRTCYKILYSSFDKIKNGITSLYGIAVDSKLKKAYFENFFNKYKGVFDKEINEHLIALYSISLELNQDNGSFKDFKVLRNDLEHNLKQVNEHFTSKDLEEITFELMKICRAAIFSFVFLVRTKTIDIKRTISLYE